MILHVFRKCYRADLFLLFISIVGHFVTYCENIEYLVFKGFLVHGDTILNCHVAPTFMFHLSSELKERLSDEIYPILHEWYIGNSYYEDDHQWSNQGELVLTSIYGIRRYTNGSSLGMHVDTANSHVISGIINVNQEDVAKPWQLVILDHDGKEHSVVIQPGDMLMYESARLLHGRPGKCLRSIIV